MVVFNFLNFFAIFFWIFYYGLGRKDQNDKFFFLSFATCLDPFWLEMKPEWCFLIFWIFFSLFFRIFYSKSGKNGRNDNFFSLFLDPCLLVLALNEVQTVLFNFWIFLPFFLKFSSLNRVVRFGMRIFFFFLSRPIPTHFHLKWSLNGVF